VLPVVLDALSGADLESRIVLIHVLEQIGGAQALEPVLAALDDANERIGGEAVRVLSNWPTVEAAPHLLKLARSDEQSRQTLGLRGYVRLARIEPVAKTKIGMLKRAMKLADRPSDKKLVLAAWGTAPSKKSLRVLLPYLNDESVVNEAAAAIISVASELGKVDEKNKARALDALSTVHRKCKDSEIRRSARRTRRSLK
jgi:hypothetical protein